jgi:hypothetical protein
MKMLTHPNGNLLLPAVTTLTLLVFSLLYIVDRPIYGQVIALWSFKPTPKPFIDWVYVVAQVKCWQAGVDVYLVNPCDPLGRLHDYSPLWLRLSFFDIAPSWQLPLGLLQDLLFAVSLGFLPAPETRRAQCLMVAALLSPMVMFALERGNVDIGMFVLVVAGLALGELRPPVALLGYAVFILAGLLKFYPLILLVRLLRERIIICLAIGSLSCLIVGWLGVDYISEVRRALGNVPVPIDFGDGFGARQFPHGLGVLLKSPGAATAAWCVVCGTSISSAILLACTAMLARWHAVMSEREASCLLAGALLFCGCFIAGPSVGYRGILLLFIMPGLLRAGTAFRNSRDSRWFNLFTVATIALLWNLIPIRYLGAKSWLGGHAGPLPFMAAWLTRETMSWVVFTFLLAVVFRFVATSQVIGSAGSTLFKMYGFRQFQRRRPIT